MNYNEKVHAEVKEIFALRRKKSAEELRAREKEVYARLPKLAEIEKEMRAVAVSAALAAVSGTSASEIKKLKKKSLSLQGERMELLASAGYLPDYLEEKHICDKCNDTGHIGTEICECYKKEIKKQKYLLSNLGAALQNQTFKNFSLDYYSKEINKQYKMSPYENMEKVVAYLKKYASKFSPESPNLLFSGKTGLGKTFLSSAVARAVIDGGNGVIYDTAQNIMNVFESNKFGSAENDMEKQYYDADLLIIDDLGAEFSTSFTTAVIFDLINKRLISGKPMIINTNLDFSELDERYSERTVSRLAGEFVMIYFFGDDIRIRKLENKNKKKSK